MPKVALFPNISFAAFYLAVHFRSNRYSANSCPNPNPEIPASPGCFFKRLKPS